ncbi:MAG: hypothetical protein IVW57_09295 [Ktedonobacterales bacterium]|nr:hypothetical protein [Ktedonobacterales bacterium]
MMRQRLSGRRMVTWLLPAMMVGILALAGCSAGSTTAGTQPTPNATTILQRATAADIKDMTFAINVTTTAAGQVLTLTGTGKIIKNPGRAQLDVGTTVSGTALTFSVITDTATQAGYVKFSGLSLPGYSTTKWTKVTLNAANGFGADTSQFTDYSKLNGATLVGAETINGVAVWHLQGKESSTGTPVTSTATPADTTADFYFRQDNYYPAKATVKTTGATPVDATITFTAINSGISITLPAASDIQPAA